MYFSRYLQKARIKLDSRNRIYSESYNECFRIVDTHQFVLAETRVGIDEYVELHITIEVRKKDNEQENARLDDLRRIEMMTVTDDSQA